MRTGQKTLLSALAAFAIAGCTVEQTREGEAPEIEVEPGTAPEYRVEPAEIEIGTDTQVVETPDIDIVPRDTIPSPQPR